MSDESFLAAARCEPLRVYGSSRCECDKVARDTKMAVQGGLRIVRLKYGIPYVELTDAVVDHLSDYLSYLLAQGKVRATVSFPRRQVRPDGDGLVSLQRLGRKERWEFAHTLNSFKRNLPLGCRRCTPSKRDDWARRAFSQPPPTSPEYIAFVRREVHKLFPVGWDRHYVSNVDNFIPRASARESLPDTSVYDRPHADIIWRDHGREEFLSRCLSETPQPSWKSEVSCRYKEVMTAGKLRPLVIYDHRIDVLGPLNTTIYDHLSRKPWLLRGAPTSARIKAVCTGRVNSSVDLVSATDGLPLDVAEEILKVLFFSCQAVPALVRRLAMSSLRPEVLLRKGQREGDGTTSRVSHGQMMGAYLSFPLLCIQSYLGARWAARFDKNAKFLVNGDDCIISASRGVLPEDYPAFFELNTKKTITSSSVVEVNSTAFLKEGDKWREVRHVRRGTVLPGYAGILHAAKAYSISPSWSTAFVKARLGRKWGLMPSQLGLDRRSHAAWRREVTMRKTRLFTELPLPKVETDPMIEIRRGETPDPDEAAALVAHIFSHGRVIGNRERYDPAIGVIRRSYRYRKIPLRSPLSYRGWRVQREQPVVSSSPFLTDYEGQRYEGKLLALGVFRSRLGL
ncbi:RNA dependent RNA polymerase [Plasmopara viticola lesion associated ourmia-like virus 41]|uniref:RNA dependent RNA polymerase n=1 Tax=Plasmopara viticola lesion associated ourmia-like virus 41 TaxID=2686511 RepID=A0ABX6FK70_9VIRU|nr:RNA dependent RNA polymerase [Plasmopara viticola lesion associated ourmia-like virus 41]QGY72571.1 RNA dependent RNA polymerase [Plasmopara viticola lesion associated ourmia-like virus 41]